MAVNIDGNQTKIGKGNSVSAQELLEILNLAEKQQKCNEKLKLLLLDNEELMLKLHQRTHVQLQRADVTRVYKHAEELLAEFERDISYANIKRYDLAKQDEAFEQELTVKELVNMGDKLDLNDLNRVSQTFRSIRGCGESAAYFDSVLDLGNGLLTKCYSLLQDSKLSTKEWAVVLESTLMLLKDVMHTPPLANCLTDQQEEVQRMRFAIDEYTQAQAQALADGEVKEAETLYYQKLKAQEVLSDMTKQKFSILDREETEAFQLPLQRVHETHSSANLEISKMLKQQEVLKQRAESDLQRLLRKWEESNTLDLQQSLKYDSAKQNSDVVLKTNYQQQQDCWTKIEELEGMLIQLGEERLAEIRRRIRAVEREAKRKEERRNVLEYCNTRKRLLDATIRNNEIAEEVTDTIDELIASICNAVERRMRENEKELESLRVGVHEEYLEAFREMYLTVGDLTYKKERNLQELEKKIQLEHIQQEFCMETFNPKAKEHSLQKKQLMCVKEDMERQLDQLREKSQLYIEWFKPSEKCLIEAGIDFKHPVEELQLKNQSREHKLIEYHELMMSNQQDDGALAEDDYSVEMAEIERLRALTVSALENRPILRLTGEETAMEKDMPS